MRSRIAPARSACAKNARPLATVSCALACVAQRRVVANLLKFERARAGLVLFEEGSPGDKLFLILRGAATIVLHTVRRRATCN